MIAGEVRSIRHTETGESAYVFDNLPTVVIIQPDGEESDPASVVSVDPLYSVSALTHTLSAVVDWAQAGVYRVKWQMDVGEDNPIIRIEEYFAAWTDVYSTIRELLDRTVTQLPDSRIDRELARTVRLLTAQFHCIGSYSALTGSDRYAFDDALGYFVAMRIRPTLGSISTGEVKRKKQDDLEIEYATGSTSTSTNTLRDWETAGWKALRGVACIGYTTPLDTRGRTGSMTPVSVLSPLGGYEDAEEYARLRGLE